MRIYLAARFGRQGELRRIAHRLEQQGHTVTSSWLVAKRDDEAQPDAAAKALVARHNLNDIDAAEVVISFTESAKKVKDAHANRRGGRHVEFGYAAARGKRLIVVGPRENVFHFLAPVGTDLVPRASVEVFKTVAEMLAGVRWR